jgi:hypothetical protein
MKFWTIILSLFFVLLVSNGCINQPSKSEVVSMQQLDINNNHGFGVGLPAMFPNIDSVCKYFDENMKDNEINYNDIINKLHNSFLQTEHSGLFGYNWFRGIVIADINNDGIFELYLNGSIGSGVIHSFVHCYDPTEDKYYIISKRFEMDYIAFVYENNIYIYGSNGISSRDGIEIKLFKPSFVNDELFLEELETNLYNEIIEKFDIGEIYNLYSLELTGNNYFD